MTKPRFCIYSRHQLIDGDIDWRPSEEHIIPLTLGGSREFATRDVSSGYNSKYGSEIDAPFVDLLPFAIKRQQLKIKNYSGRLKAIEFKVAPRGHDYRATVTIDPDLNVSVRFAPAGTSTEHGKDLVCYEFAGSPDDVEKMFKGALSKAKKKGQLLYAFDGSHLTTVADAEEAATATAYSEFVAQIDMPLQVWMRGICKIVLGLGHLVMGPAWTFSPSADYLRTVLEMPVCDSKSWIEKSVRHAPAEIATSFGIDGTIRTNDLHTLAIIPKQGAQGPYALVSLFGGNAFRDVIVEIGPDAGSLVVQGDTLATNRRLGVRIDPRTRSVDWIDVAKWTTWSQALTDPTHS